MTIFGSLLMPTCAENGATIRFRLLRSCMRFISGCLPDLRPAFRIELTCSRLQPGILVNHARDLHALKRGGDAIKLSLGDLHAFGQQPQDVLDLNMALERLAELDPRAAEVVELRYFGGLSEPETAEAMQISLAMVKRDWNFARTWLLRRLAKAGLT
jgi:hypothetical protein